MSKPKPKRLRIQTFKQARARLLERRGDISVPNYRPYISIHDFSSYGRVSRVVQDGRIAHTMSDIETGFLRSLQWDLSVTAIYDQVALADFNNCSVRDTVAIARSLGIVHPVHSKDRTPMVMTTDFVAKYEAKGGPEFRAYAIKPTSAFVADNTWSGISSATRTRTIEKLEIERRYWKRKGVKWTLITDEKVCQISHRNIELFLGAQEPLCVSLTPNWEQDFIKFARRMGPDTTLSDWRSIKKLKPSWLVEPADVNECFRWLCGQRKINFDLTRPFDRDIRFRDFDFEKPSL